MTIREIHWSNPPSSTSGCKPPPDQSKNFMSHYAPYSWLDYPKHFRNHWQPQSENCLGRWVRCLRRTQPAQAKAENYPEQKSSDRPQNSLRAQISSSCSESVEQQRRQHNGCLTQNRRRFRLIMMRLPVDPSVWCSFRRRLSRKTSIGDSLHTTGHGVPGTGYSNRWRCRRPVFARTSPEMDAQFLLQAGSSSGRRAYRITFRASRATIDFRRGLMLRPIAIPSTTRRCRWRA